MNAITGTMATVRKDELSAALKAVTRVVERRNTVPILGHVSLTGNREGLTVRGTNMEAEATAIIPARGASRLNITACATTLRDMVARLGDEEVGLRQSDSHLHVQAGEFSARLIGLHPDDFPRLAAIDWKWSFEIAADVLRGMFARVEHAISKEATRYYLNGVFLHVNVDGRLAAVTTDGHRMALTSATLPAGAEGMPGLILPRHALSVLMEMIRKGSDSVRVAIGERVETGTRKKRDRYGKATEEDEEYTNRYHRASFSVGGVSLDTKLIEGTFPDYWRVIPKDAPAVASMDPAALLGAVKRIWPIGNGRSRPVKVEFLGERIKLSMRSADSGEVEDAIRVQPIGTFRHEIGFNGAYLMAMAKQFGGRLTMHAADAHGPMVAHDEADPHARYILMPMRI